MKLKKIRELVCFLGEFYNRQKQLPPGWDNVMYNLSQDPFDLMKFIEAIEIRYPAALMEMARLQNPGDNDTADDEPEHPGHPGISTPQRSAPLEGKQAGNETGPELNFHYQRMFQ